MTCLVSASCLHDVMSRALARNWAMSSHDLPIKTNGPCRDLQIVITQVGTFTFLLLLVRLCAKCDHRQFCFRANQEYVFLWQYFNKIDTEKHGQIKLKVRLSLQQQCNQNKKLVWYWPDNWDGCYVVTWHKQREHGVQGLVQPGDQPRHLYSTVH